MVKKQGQPKAMTQDEASPKEGDVEFPQKLRDLDKDTIEWLWRLNPDQRDALNWVCDLEEYKRDRLDLFLSLSKENFEAEFTIVEWWSKIAWLGRTSFWIMSGVVAILLFLNQIQGFWTKYFPGGGTP